MNITQNQELLEKIKSQLLNVGNAIVSKKDLELEKGIKLMSLVVEELKIRVNHKDYDSLTAIHLFFWYILNSSTQLEREGLIIKSLVTALMSRDPNYFCYSLNKKEGIIDKKSNLKVHSIVLQNVLKKIAKMYFPGFFKKSVTA